MIMESHEVLRAVAKKQGLKRLAAELKVSPKLFQKWTQPVGPEHDGRVNPAERMDQIRQFTGDTRLLEWLCERAGGNFVRGGKLHRLVCAECERTIAGLEKLMQSGDGSWQLADGEKQIGNGQLNIGNVRGCRYRRADGRCGLRCA
jgi:hypothetical protein